MTAMIRRFAIAALSLAAAACASTSGVAPVEHRRAGGDAPPGAAARAGPELPQAAPGRSSEISAQPLSAGSLEPAEPAPAGGAARADSITVRKGDTLFSLSERHAVPLHSLIAVNGLEPPYTIRVGQTLRLPRPETHVVAPGDTVNKIAARYNIDPPSLILLNQIRTPDLLTPGQVILLPADAPIGRAPTPPSQSASRTEPAAPRQETSATDRGVEIRHARFDWPLTGPILSGFGPKARGLQNDGINISAAEGSEVRAAGDGVVVYAGNELAGYGELLLVEHDGGWITAYAHNRALKVGEGERVSRGQVIAEAGQTGSVDAPQLHFEVRRGVQPVDPMEHLPAA